ncbi:MAG: hypothetical protein NZM04_09595 [Methylacidiphilales bacterium]|nr:hypothetical protein [Candidatus Methylacidiphilales bacterium]
MHALTAAADSSMEQRTQPTAATLPHTVKGTAFVGLSVVDRAATRRDLPQPNRAATCQTQLDVARRVESSLMLDFLTPCGVKAW